MSSKKNLLYGAAFSIAALSSASAQDTIIKTNGDIIYAKVVEIGTNGVSYKKTGFEEGPTYIEEKSNMVVIKFKNGTKEQFMKPTNPATSYTTQAAWPNAQGQANTQQQQYSMQNGQPSTQMPSNPASDYMKSGPVNNSQQNRIEHMNNKYTINGQKASSKDVDRMLNKSTNPAVQVMAKTAKASKTLQKVVGYTSIPSTIAGGVASAFTFVDMFKSLAKTGVASPNTYLNAGMSLLGTLTLPITNKILSNRRDKLYDRAIDMYNLRN